MSEAAGGYIAYAAITGGSAYKSGQASSRRSQAEIAMTADDNAIYKTSYVKSSEFFAPKIFTNSKGQLTNGTFAVDATGMVPHKTGSLAGGKSQFISGVDAEKAVLDAASYADANGLWVGNKAKVFVSNGPVGASGKTGELTNWINVYKTKTGFVHGCPGNQ